MNGRKPPSSVSRRQILKGLAAGGAVAAITFPASANIPTGPKAGAVTVFRLRTRDTHACNACQIHHRYKIFKSMAAANNNRAHPGCNCPITKQKLAGGVFQALFLDTGAIETGVVDLRTISS